MTKSDRLVTTAEVARTLRVSESRVRQLEREGHLAAARTSSGVRIFTVADVERLAAERARRVGRRGQ